MDGQLPGGPLGDRAFWLYKQVLTQGFDKGAAVLWMDLVWPSMREALPGDTSKIDQRELAWHGQCNAEFSSTARRVVAWLREENWQSPLWEIAEACAARLEAARKDGCSDERLAAWTEVIRDAFGDDRLLAECGVLPSDQAADTMVDEGDANTD